jgi:hypothetical protein
VNFRTTKESYKSDKQLYNNPEDWVIIENTQDPIIEEGVFWTVQNIRPIRNGGEASKFTSSPKANTSISKVRWGWYVARMPLKGNLF